MVLLVVVLIGASCSGCATAMRGDLKDDGAHLYPATRMDGMMIADAFSGSPVCTMSAEGNPAWVNAIFGGLFQFVIFGVDLPISVVTDTACVPYDLWEKNKANKPSRHTVDSRADASANGW